ncbi:MAG TPA: hypothetical protein PKK00_12065 [Bacteroidales bacterium]|nr:hypothetical protein [Bacteroidales bacterium]HPS17533.1 hypothetical protein [Bacteroidales bacterium]
MNPWKLHSKFIRLLCIAILFFASNKSFSQGSGGPTPTSESLTFELKTNPTVDFVFNTYSSFLSGITKFNVLTLNVLATGVQWDMYVSAQSTSTGYWDNVVFYTSNGEDSIPTTLLQVKVSDANNTPNALTFFPVPDNTAPAYIIGTSNIDAAVNCALGNHTNVEGSYITTPSCYKFNVDFRIVPGINNYRSGLYSLNVEFTLIEDL